MHPQPALRPKNRSELSDELFYALSRQGQEAAIRAARPPKQPKPKALSPSQEKQLLRALVKHPWQHQSSDCRSEDILVQLGLLKHIGGVVASRPTAAYKLTDTGLELANALKAKAAASAAGS